MGARCYRRRKSRLVAARSNAGIADVCADDVLWCDRLQGLPATRSVQRGSEHGQFSSKTVYCAVSVIRWHPSVVHTWSLCRYG